jgi:hypothetical protein
VVMRHYYLFGFVFLLTISIVISSCSDTTNTPIYTPSDTNQTPASSTTQNVPSVTTSITASISPSITPSLTAVSEPLVLEVGGSGKYKTIQAAIDVAKSGTTIQVSQGIYLENVTITSSKNLIIQGGWDQQFSSRNEDSKLTVIDGGGKNSVFFIEARSGINIKVIIDGVTIQNGEASIGAGIWAAALTIDSHLELTLKNSLVTRNETNGYGQAGGISIRAFAGYVEATLLNNTITQNKASNFGGGIVIMTGDAGSENVKLIKNVVTNNIVTRFQEPNVGGGDGGGIAVYGSGKDSNLLVSFTNNIITNNQAGYGGGIYGHSLNEAITKLTLKNNIVAGNSGNGIFSNCGAVAQGEKPGGQINWELTNNTITGNAVGSNNAGGVWTNTADGASTIVSSYNDIIWGNENPQSGPQLFANTFHGQSGKALIQVSFSNIDGIGGSEGVTINTNNIIDQAPQFENPAANDFRLKDNSPCIDSGDPNIVFNDGQLLPAKGTKRNDLGAYGGPANFDWPITETG